MRLLLALALASGLALAPAFAEDEGSPGMGPMGPMGPTGAVGPAGPKGEAGPKGDQGAVGQAGPKGDAGSAGSPGAAGQQGIQGVPGKDGAAGAAGAKGETGLQGATGAAGASITGPQGPSGPAGAPKRVERYTATTNASGSASYTWTACTSAPDVDVILGWTTGTPAQMITGAITASTNASATAAVKVSQGTVLLSGSAFATAPAGTPLAIRVICN
ncbi:collagen-like domain-containing protein [Methylobacterium goesingense]|uniref:Collagen triple helix repeat-containing protein n=1 Tax=Methylobacterium goesingense TaxID=243690 RepID=A0ABV2L445_9HYPH|nr:hypothetical protein [Methylobacterium goesingense]GJD72561.1 hypothetical protein CFIICLFH_0778 [Methylobacterium goesingense]